MPNWYKVSRFCKQYPFINHGHTIFTASTLFLRMSRLYFAHVVAVHQTYTRSLVNLLQYRPWSVSRNVGFRVGDTILSWSKRALSLRFTFRLHHCSATRPLFVLNISLDYRYCSNLFRRRAIPSICAFYLDCIVMTEYLRMSTISLSGHFTGSTWMYWTDN